MQTPGLKSQKQTHKEGQPRFENPNLLLSSVIKGGLHVSMNSITPNLLEKFSQRFIFHVLFAGTNNIYSFVFPRLFSATCLSLCSLKGGVLIKSGEASSISREKLDIF